MPTRDSGFPRYLSHEGQTYYSSAPQQANLIHLQMSSTIYGTKLKSDNLIKSDIILIDLLVVNVLTNLQVILMRAKVGVILKNLEA